MKDNNLISLAPTDDAENLKYYEKHITNALENKNNLNECKNRSIAFTGDFGIGKSSILRTYFRKHSEYNVIYVTLSSYLVNKISETEVVNIDEIEYSILEQIIYTKRPHELPLSHFNRIDESKGYFQLQNFLISLSITVILLLFVLILNYQNLLDYLKTKLELGDIVFYHILAITIFASSLYYLLKTFPIKKINFKNSKSNLEIELSKKDTTSILNQNIEELINFFLYTDNNIVIFEDIDRLSCSKKIFSKLKEINTIINNACHNNIRFIYVLGDGVFANSEVKLKFFDIIIPIIPIVNTYNSYYFIQEVFDKYDIKIEKNVLNLIAPYLKNIRYIYNLVNEYILYLPNTYTNADKRELLLLLTLKQIYPQKFENLANQKGKLAFFCDNKFEKIVTECYFKNSKNEIKEQKKNKDNLFKEFKNYLITNQTTIFQNIKQNYGALHTICLSSEKTKCNLDLIFDNLEDFISDILYDKYYISSPKQLVKKSFLEAISNIPLKEIEIFKDKLITCDKIIKKNKLEISMGKYEKIDIDFKLDILNKIQDLPSDFKTDITDILNSFEENIIKSNIFNSQYKRLISFKLQNKFTLTDNDINILSCITSGIKLSDNYHIDDINKVFKELMPTDFTKESIMVKEVFIELLKRGNAQEYLEQYCHNITVNKVKFILELENSNIHIFDKCKHSLLGIMSKLSLPKEDIYQLIFYFVKYIDPKDYVYLPYNFEKLLSDNTRLFSLFESRFQEIGTKLLNYNIVFSKNISFESTPKNMLKLIYNNKMYEKSSNHIIPIVKCFDIPYDETRVVDMLYDLDNNNKLRKYLLEDIKDTILNYITTLDKQQSREENIARLTKDYHLDNNTFLTLIKTQETNIENLSLFDNKYRSIIIYNKNYIINWLNIYILFKRNGLTEDIIKLVQINISSLLRDKYDKHIYKDLTNNLVNISTLDNKDYLALAKKIIDRNISLNVRGLPINNLQILINNNLVTLDKDDLSYLLILDINDDKKAKVLGDNYTLLLDKNKPIIKESIISKIFTSEYLLDNKQKITIIKYNLLYLKIDKVEKVILAIALKGLNNRDILKHLFNSHKIDINIKKQLYYNNRRFLNNNKDIIPNFIKSKR